MLVNFDDYEGAQGRLRFRKLRSDREVFILTQIVADDCNVCLTKLLRRTRGCGRAARARQIAVYLAHVLLSRPQEVVADLFARDRTTIAHAVQAVEDRRDDTRLNARLEKIEARFLAARTRSRLNNAA